MSLRTAFQLSGKSFRRIFRTIVQTGLPGTIVGLLVAFDIWKLSPEQVSGLIPMLTATAAIVQNWLDDKDVPMPTLLRRD